MRRVPLRHATPTTPTPARPPPPLLPPISHPQEWADRYQADRAAATAELLTLLVSACGAAGGVVSAADVDDGEVDRLVASLNAAVTQSGVVDPFRAGPTGARGAKAARAAYAGLWAACAREHAARGLTGDGYFVDRVTAVLLGLSW